MSGKIKVLVRLSSLLLGQALQNLINKDDDFEIAVVPDTIPNTAMEPDLLLVDVFTMERAAHAPWPDARLILIDMGLPDSEIISLLLNYKFYGVIATDTSPDLFIKALRIVHEGQIWIDNEKIKALLHNASSQKKLPDRSNLSKKEQDIVAFIAQGLKNREIAHRLCISEQTVKTHISRIFKKVNVISRSQLAPLALKLRF